MKRNEYYNPVLDPKSKAVEDTFFEDREYKDGGPLTQPTEENPANLVSSLCDDGFHRPAIDIDIPCRYVESSTPGHGHLYFDELSLPWEKYCKLLDALVDAGIVEEAYYEVSLARGQTLLRKPGIQKYSVLKDYRGLH